MLGMGKVRLFCSLTALSPSSTQST